MDQGNKLGKRLVCEDCSTKYYDFNRDSALCPKCGAKKILKKVTESEMPAPMAIEINEEDDVKSDDMELEPLDDIDLVSGDDNEEEDEDDSEDNQNADVPDDPIDSDD
ncbi:FYDLN acid domain-containing protein [bacterium]|nr:FYDLN acid domain-containing protein [bacterium]